MTNTNISQTPENEALSAELSKLNTEFLELFTRHKDMVDEEPVIYSLYLNRLGWLVFELFGKKTEYSRLKMKMELIQSAINRNEKPDLPEIENKLNNQLSDYYKQIEENTGLLDEAKKVLTNLLPPEFVAELKDVFRVLCKKLHPDLNPNQPESDKELFLRVKAAYDLNDLPELKKILLFMDSRSETLPPEQTADMKLQRIEFLKKNIESLKEKIQQLSVTFPYNMKELIADDEKTAVEQEAIKNQISFYEKEIINYQAFIELMLS